METSNEVQGICARCDEWFLTLSNTDDPGIICWDCRDLVFGYDPDEWFSVIYRFLRNGNKL
jgi:hypothetical protein